MNLISNIIHLAIYPLDLIIHTIIDPIMVVDIMMMVTMVVDIMVAMVMVDMVMVIAIVTVYRISRELARMATSMEEKSNRVLSGIWWSRKARPHQLTVATRSTLGTLLG